MCIDNATFFKTVFLQDILHHIIVMMCVYTYIMMLLEAPSDAFVCNSFFFPIGSHTVNYTIGGLIQPLAIIDNRIGRIFSGNKTEGAYNFSLLILAHIAVAVGYFLLNPLSVFLCS